MALSSLTKTRGISWATASYRILCSTNFSNSSITLSSFTSNEFWKKKFRKALSIRDIRGDGTITCGDFQLISQRYRDMGAAEGSLYLLRQSSNQLMEKCGLADGSKSLSYDEFAEKYIAMIEKDGFEFHNLFFADMFNVIDTNSDGEISLQEWINYSKAIGISDAAHSKASFGAMDTDGDGSVSREEFLAYNKEFFCSTDDNLKSSILFGPLE